MLRICQELGLDGPQITMQGALIANPRDGQVLAEWHLESDDALAHVRFARQMGAVPFFCFADGFRGETLSPDIISQFAPYEEPLPMLVPDIACLAASRPLKTFLYTPHGSYERVWKAAQLQLAGRATVTAGDEHSIELLPLGASKGEALRTLAVHLGVSLADTAAIGDGRNDIAMLRAAGRSAAMADARPEVRAAAEFVVSSNQNEGVLEALDRFYPNLAPFDQVLHDATDRWHQ
jgi:Cof subfamily protein (haloacid dehalogenase superfamily)